MYLDSMYLIVTRSNIFYQNHLIKNISKTSSFRATKHKPLDKPLDTVFDVTFFEKVTRNRHLK